ncbi:helix-turn-helix domain-containing protein [Verrucosispora sp. WMMD703]|uniref:helix-turn-helix domain-containing protein n=1 Tax=Verrucosispora sp. WMMD703 TaxID=3403463 RepID=UPI003B95329F
MKPDRWAAPISVASVTTGPAGRRVPGGTVTDLSFGPRLRELRRSAGLTIEELAEASGVSGRAASRANPRPTRQRPNGRHGPLDMAGRRRPAPTGRADGGRDGRRYFLAGGLGG